MNAIKIVGGQKWPRFVIVRLDDDFFWSGKEFLPDLKQALLYAHPALAERECEKLWLHSHDIFPPDEDEQG